MKKTKFFLAGVSMMIMLGGCDNFSTPITKEEPTDRQAIPLREQVSVESLDKC